MLLVLDESVTEAPFVPEVLALWALAYSGRHRVMPHPSAEQKHRDWCQRQDPDVRAMVEYGNEASLRAETTNPARLRAIVRGGPSDWAADPLELSPFEALSFALRPVHLLCENEASDWSFLLRMAGPIDARRLRRYQELDYIVLHGGGIDEVRRGIRDRASDPQRCRLVAAFFDSDAKEPAKPSTAAERTREACGVLVHHMLSRRAIENYLTLPALRKWAHHPRVPRRQRRLDRRDMKVRALAAKSRDERDHIDMKQAVAPRIAQLFADDYYAPELDGADDGELTEFIRTVIDTVGASTGDLL